jgi:hypothetical protein
MRGPARLAGIVTLFGTFLMTVQGLYGGIDVQNLGFSQQRTVSGLHVPCQPFRAGCIVCILERAPHRILTADLIHPRQLRIYPVEPERRQVRGDRR